MKWLHLHHIRVAVSKPGILIPEFYSPFLHTCLRALPYTFRNVEAPEGTCVQLLVTYEITEAWRLVKRRGQWVLSEEENLKPTTVLTVDGNAAWKLFSKSWRAADARPFVKIEGDTRLAEQVLEMVSFMA